MVMVVSDADQDILLEPLPLLLDEPVDIGGEAFIYAHPTNPSLLIKVFHEENVRTPRTGSAAAHLVELFALKSGVTPSQSRRLSDSFSWPCSLYGDSVGRIEGIAIRKADVEFWLEYSNIHEKIRTVQNLVFLGDALSKPIIVDAPYTSMALDVRIELACELLRSMSILWELGYRYCDYSEKNLLWSFSPRPKIFVIDIEGCELPGVRGNRTNGWVPRENQLGHSLETDRSLCALAIWRILCADMEQEPPKSEPGSPARSLNKLIVRLIEELRNFGREDTCKALLKELSKYRSQKIENFAFDWAISTRYARTVLEYAPSQPDENQRRILALAEQQLELEREILSVEPIYRKLRLNRSVPLPGFEFDIAVGQTTIRVHQDAELLREMALQGEFETVAEIFATESDCMEINQVIRRSVQAALAYSEKLEINSVTTRHGFQRCEWSWPGAQYINCARVEVVDSDGQVITEAFALRENNAAGVTLPTSGAFPSGSSLRVTLGLRTRDGQTVFSVFSKQVPLLAATTLPVRRSSSQRPVLNLEERTWTPIPARPPSSDTNVGSGTVAPLLSAPQPLGTPSSSAPNNGFMRNVFTRLFRRRR